MTTKDNLTFSQLKVRLYSLSSNVDSRTAGTALVAELTSAADAYVRHSPAFPEWKFDTGSSAHMTNEIGQFQQLTPHNGTIRVGGNSILRSEGIGTVVLPTHPVSVRLCDVLYVHLH